MRKKGNHSNRRRIFFSTSHSLPYIALPQFSLQNVDDLGVMMDAEDATAAELDFGGGDDDDDDGDAFAAAMNHASAGGTNNIKRCVSDRIRRRESVCSAGLTPAKVTSSVVANPSTFLSTPKPRPATTTTTISNVGVSSSVIRPVLRAITRLSL